MRGAESLPLGQQPAEPVAMYFNALDSLRGICASLVVLHHFRVQSLIYALPIVQNGWVFVDFFFVLSGFVLRHSYGQRLAAGSIGVAAFMMRRMGRIYPLHFFMTMTLIALEFVRLSGIVHGRPPFDEGSNPCAILTHLLLLQSMGIHDIPTWNGASWSIAAEIWAYLLFAVVMSGMPKHAKPIIIAMAGASFAIILFCSGKGLNVTYDYGLLRGVLGFSIGFMVHVAFVAGFRPAGTIAEILAVATLWGVVTIVTEDSISFLILPAVANTVLVFASQKGAISQMLRGTIPTFVGRISYSIYLTHGLVLFVFFEAMKRGGRFGYMFGAGSDAGEIAAPPILGDLTIIFAIAGVIVLASITYRWIELPARQWVNRRVVSMGMRAA